MVSSAAWSSYWRYSSFCRPHTQKQTQTKRVHNLHKPCGISYVFIIMLRLQYTCTWRIMVILIAGKTWIPQWEPHAGIKMAHVLGSLVYNSATDQYRVAFCSVIPVMSNPALWVWEIHSCSTSNTTGMQQKNCTNLSTQWCNTTYPV